MESSNDSNEIKKHFLEADKMIKELLTITQKHSDHMYTSKLINTCEITNKLQNLKITQESKPSLEIDSVEIPYASKRNLRKKDLCATKKAKNEWLDSLIINEVNSNIIVNRADKRENIFYDPLKKSEDFVASDFKSKNDSQSIFLMDPKITLFEKFAERRWQRQVIKTLLN
ncbi:hypothetical protein C2G38_2170630 [Gigaspora rosea]|uniref:Uncharacterized protein n=1 Tax=Gigaspora rosea TaxID=44941 RepID=A0A397VP17_9GLOM|nr:hypothetical protein C2G38_2170630 [Gigaspora rosea]